MKVESNEVAHVASLSGMTPSDVEKELFMLKFKLILGRIRKIFTLIT